MFLSLKKGDVVDVIFPATGCSKNEISAIKNYLKNYYNLEVRIALETEIILAKETAKNEFPTNSISFRFEQLKLALESKDSKIIWCGRGGYGSGDLLPLLEKLKPIKQNKLFIGFSDIVSLTTFLEQKWGWQVLCAPVLLQLARGDIQKPAQKELKDLIFGQKTEFKYDLKALNEFGKKEISGSITGGCLSVLAGHFGGNYQTDFQNKILFLEDEGEDGERLDRYFRQVIEVILKEKKKPQAILLGNFKTANIHGTPKAKNIEIAIKNLIERIANFNLKIPVFLEKSGSLGHSSKMRPLILGVASKITNQKLQFSLPEKSEKSKLAPKKPKSNLKISLN